MSLFDQLLQQAQGLDLGAVAQRVGLTPDQIATAGTGRRCRRSPIPVSTITRRRRTWRRRPGSITASSPPWSRPSLNRPASSAPRGGPFSSILNGLGVAPPDAGAAQSAPAAAPAAAPAGGESMFDRLKHAVDQDGDGNPLNDIMNKLGGH